MRSATAQIYERADDAFKVSREKNLPVLLIFSGSDWCSPCMRFKNKVLSDVLFQDYAATNLVMLNADFPQRKKLSADVEKQNEQLAEKYNRNGLFPQLVLIYPATQHVIYLSYTNQSPADFISELRTQISYEHHAGSK